MINYSLYFTIHAIPLAAFWSLLYFGRHDLQPRAIMAFAGTWLAALLSVIVFDVPSGLFPAAEAVLAIVLVLLVFGGDFRIRG